MAKKIFKLNVNGQIYRVKAEPDEPLLWVLRDDLDLIGTKFGCGVGECGACSVLINNVARRSCQVQIQYASSGQKIVTIEGLGIIGNLSLLQEAFVEHTAFGCGFCTPGIIINATALLNLNPNPTRKEIAAALDNNLCRCGSHLNVIEAIMSVVNKNKNQP